MNLTKQQRLLAVIAIAMVALFMADKIVFTPLARNQVVGLKDIRRAKGASVHDLHGRRLGWLIDSGQARFDRIAKLRVVIQAQAGVHEQLRMQADLILEVETGGKGAPVVRPQ